MFSKQNIVLESGRNGIVNKISFKNFFFLSFYRSWLVNFEPLSAPFSLMPVSPVIDKALALSRMCCFFQETLHESPQYVGH